MKKYTYSSRVKAPTTVPVDSTSSNRTHDDTPPNPSGRDVSDRRSKPNKFLSCKQLTQIATLNVRTLRKENKRLELAANFNSCNLDILEINDHKIVHEDPVRFQKLDKCTLVTTSAWRSANNASSGGVGFLFSDRIMKVLSDIKPINNRILQVNISGNPCTSIVVNYAPVEGDDAAEEHFQKLSDIVNGIPKHNLVIELGDFNAHLGEEHARYTYHQSTNTNGKFLLEHALECDMLINNTRFEKKKGKLWTLISDLSGRKSRIDYILVNKKWKNSVKNVEPYNSFSSLGSDHRLLTARIKQSLRMTKNPPRKKNFDWSTLRNTEIQTMYTITVKNRFAELGLESDCSTVKYENFIQANKEAAEALIVQKKRNKQKRASGDPRVQTARTNVQTAFSDYQVKSSDENQCKLQTEKMNLSNVYDTIMEEDLTEMIKQVEEADAKSRHGESWRLINNISGRKSAKRGLLKGSTKEERINK
jgi:exonuclease III